jgi:hypothetical protein
LQKDWEEQTSVAKAAIDFASLTARVELVSFPVSPQKIFPQALEFVTFPDPP